jgi:hypothetical protein
MLPVGPLNVFSSVSLVVLSFLQLYDFIISNYVIKLTPEFILLQINDEQNKSLERTSD